MKINFLFLLMLSILFLNGCATTHYMEFTAVALPDQKTGPYGAVVSEKIHMVSVLQYKEIQYMKENAIFNIIIENRGEEPLTIGNENISIIFEGHDKKHTVKMLDVLSAREFMNDVEYEYRKRQLGIISGIVYTNDYRNAYALNETGTPTPANFYNVFPPNSYIPRNSSFQLIGYLLKLKNINIYLNSLRETQPDLFFDQKTIMPRESIIVLISCRTSEIPRWIEGDLKINVSIDREEHGFTFARR